MSDADVALVREAVQRCLALRTASGRLDWEMDDVVEDLGGGARALLAVSRRMTKDRRAVADFESLAGGRTGKVFEGGRVFGPAAMLAVCRVPVHARRAGEVMMGLRPCVRWRCEVDAVAAADVLGRRLPLPQGLTTASVRAMAVEVMIDADGMVRGVRTGSGEGHGTRTFFDLEYGVEVGPATATSPLAGFPVVDPLGTAGIARVEAAREATVATRRLSVVKRLGHQVPDLPGARGKLLQAGLGTMMRGGEHFEFEGHVDLDLGREGQDFSRFMDIVDDRTGGTEIGALWMLDALGGVVGAEGDRVQVDLMRCPRPLVLPRDCDTGRLRAYDMTVRVEDGLIREMTVADTIQTRTVTITGTGVEPVADDYWTRIGEGRDPSEPPPRLSRETRRELRRMRADRWKRRLRG